MVISEVPTFDFSVYNLPSVRSSNFWISVASHSYSVTFSDIISVYGDWLCDSLKVLCSEISVRLKIMIIVCHVLLLLLA